MHDQTLVYPHSLFSILIFSLNILNFFHLQEYTIVINSVEQVGSVALHVNIFLALHIRNQIFHKALPDTLNSNIFCMLDTSLYGYVSSTYSYIIIDSYTLSVLQFLTLECQCLWS